jgi:hypothetical protein
LQLSLLDANDPLLKEQYKEFLEELQLDGSDVEVCSCACMLLTCSNYVLLQYTHFIS